MRSWPLFKCLFSIYFVLFWASFSFAEKAALIDLTNGPKPWCQYLLDPFLSSELSKITRSSDRPTAIYGGHNAAGQVILRKDPNSTYPSLSPWESTYSSPKYPSSPQGDPRWFFYVAGVELALNFGFNIKLSEQGIELLAPGAKLLGKTVGGVNKILIRDGHDPIVFLPVYAKYLNGKEALVLSVSAEAPYVAFFPYWDDNPELTPHEIAWHLIAMLFPKKFHDKSRAIDLEILKVAKLIENSGLPNAHVVSQLLQDSRAHELDAGNAEAAANLAALRVNSKMQSYRDTATLLEDKPTTTRLVIDAIAKLTWPYHSPHEVAILKLRSLIGLDVSDLPSGLLSVRDKKQYSDWMDSRMRSPEFIRLSSEQRESPAALFEYLMNYMDGRLVILNEAFRKLAHEQQGN